MKLKPYPLLILIFLAGCTATEYQSRFHSSSSISSKGCIVFNGERKEKLCGITSHQPILSGFIRKNILGRNVSILVPPETDIVIGDVEATIDVYAFNDKGTKRHAMFFAELCNISTSCGELLVYHSFGNDRTTEKVEFVRKTVNLERKAYYQHRILHRGDVERHLFSAVFEDSSIRIQLHPDNPDSEKVELAWQMIQSLEKRNADSQLILEEIDKFKLARETEPPSLPASWKYQRIANTALSLPLPLIINVESTNKEPSTVYPLGLPDSVGMHEALRYVIDVSHDNDHRLFLGLKNDSHRFEIALFFSERTREAIRELCKYQKISSDVQSEAIRITKCGRRIIGSTKSALFVFDPISDDFSPYFLSSLKKLSIDE